MKTHYKYIHFVRVEPDKPRKTSIWECRGNGTSMLLGTVKWYGAWRQYCFHPEGMTVFNTGCLADIQDFLEQLRAHARRPKVEGK